MEFYKATRLSEIYTDSIELVEEEFRSNGYKQYRDYLFSEWITIKAGKKGTMRIVKPHPDLLTEWDHLTGYEPTALMPKRLKDGSFNWVMTGRESSIDFGLTAVIGNTSTKK